MAKPFKPVRNRLCSDACFERLERRDLLAAAWQNPDLPCDVDASNLVTPIDALVVVNSLNRDGARVLAPVKPAPTEPFLDVDGDNHLTALDALLIVNALNRSQRPSTLTASLRPQDDPNFNGIVLGEQVQVTVQTAPRSRVIVRQEAEPAGSGPIVALGNSDSQGAFRTVLSLVTGANLFSIEARDELGRRSTLTRSWQRGDLVADWNATMLNAIRDWTTLSDDPYPRRIVPSRPGQAARNLAMVHVAMFDAINAVEGRYTPYFPDLPRDEQASPLAALATAAHRVAASLYSDRDELPVWDATLQASLDLVPDGEAKTRGIQLGEQVAQRMLAARASDGSLLPSHYVPSDLPGRWNRTAPDLTPPELPQWARVTPFALADATAFRPAPPPDLGSPQYAAAVDEVLRLGRIDSTERTPEQTELVTFWANGPGTATPPGHWNRIATDLLMTDGRDLLDHARTLALLNLALADAAITAWDAKYQYDLWRPLHAIRRASEDGNDATLTDSNWLPLLKTPAHPSYVSGHSTFSAAAATVLTELFGDQVTFTSTTDPLSGLTQRPLAPELIVTRQFTSFWQAAEQAGLSRIYGGIHYAFDNTAGMQLGKAVGEAVIGHWLQPTAPHP